MYFVYEAIPQGSSKILFEVKAGLHRGGRITLP